MDAINRYTAIEIINDLKNKYNYDGLKAKNHYKEHIKQLIIYRLLRIRHHYFYVAYDTLIAISVILLISMIGYIWRKDDIVFILAAALIFVLFILGFFIAISKNRTNALMTDFEEEFD